MHIKWWNFVCFEFYMSTVHKIFGRKIVCFVQLDDKFKLVTIANQFPFTGIEFCGIHLWCFSPSFRNKKCIQIVQADRSSFSYQFCISHKAIWKFRSDIFHCVVKRWIRHALCSQSAKTLIAKQVWWRWFFFFYKIVLVSILWMHSMIKDDEDILNKLTKLLAIELLVLTNILPMISMSKHFI